MATLYYFFTDVISIVNMIITLKESRKQSKTLHILPHGPHFHFKTGNFLSKIQYCQVYGFLEKEKFPL